MASDTTNEVKLKKFRIVADVMTSCTYEIEAETEVAAKKIVEDEEDITPYFVEAVTSPMIVDIREIK